MQLPKPGARNSSDSAVDSHLATQSFGAWRVVDTFLLAFSSRRSQVGLLEPFNIVVRNETNFLFDGGARRTSPTIQLLTDIRHTTMTLKGRKFSGAYQDSLLIS